MTPECQSGRSEEHEQWADDDVLLWPSGVLEFRVFAIESGEEVATEHHEVHGNEELVAVLRRVVELMAAAEAAR